MQVFLLLAGIYTVSCFNIYTKPKKTFKNRDDVLFGQAIVQSKEGVFSTSPNSKPQKIFSCTLDKTNCTDVDFSASSTVNGLRPIVSMTNHFTEDTDKLMVCQQVRIKKNLNEDFNGKCTLFFDFPNPTQQHLNPVVNVVDQQKQNILNSNNNNNNNHHNNNNNNNEDEDEDDDSGTEIAFVLDGSGSISEQDFEKAKLFMTTVMTNVWEKCLNCEFAVVQYGSKIRAELLLTENSDGAKALEKVKNIKQIGVGTVTASAILYLLNHSFVPENGSKSENKKIMIVVSDGDISHWDKTYLEPALKLLEEKNISRFAVGVGDQTKITNKTKEDMKRIAGKSENSFFVDDYNALLNILSQLETSIIQGIEGIKQGGGFQFQMAEAGFSSHMTRKGALLFGAVGAHDWSGGLILKRPDQDHVTFLNGSSSGPRFSYLGYSVESAGGPTGTMSYISGAPRYNLVGGVFVFDAVSLQQRQILQGEQVGSYFGSVLCSLDINMDGMTDFLLVGAPFFHIDAEEGRVYVYKLHQGMFQVEFKWQGIQKIPYARFGSAISTVGDLDGNLFNDVAVGAPLEEHGSTERIGSVYIFNAYREGIETQYSQRIVASDFEMKLRYFGQSVSAFSNHQHRRRQLYIAVGSQGAVTVLETIPTIAFGPKLKLSPKIINLEDTKNASAFTLDICLGTGQHGNINDSESLSISYHIDLDVGQNNKRIGFHSEGEKEGQFSLLSDRDCFSPIKLDYLECYDCYSPIEIRLRYSLLSSSERPLRVLDRRTPTEVTEKLEFEKECVIKDKCIPNISLSASRLSHTMVTIGRTKTLAGFFSLTNRGDGAYMTTLLLTYPNILLFSVVESNPGVHGPACDNEVNQENSTLRCHLIHPVFKRDDKVNFTVNWQLSDQKSEVSHAEISAKLTCVNLNTVLDTKMYHFGISNALSLHLAGEAIPQLVKVADVSEDKDVDFVFQLHGKNTFNATTQVNISMDVQAQHTDVKIISVLPKNACNIPASPILKPSVEYLILCEGANLGKIVIKVHASIRSVHGSSETLTAKANLGFDKDLYTLVDGTAFVEAKVTILKQEVVKSLTAIIGGSIGGILLLLLILFALFKCGFFKRRKEVKETSHAD